MTENIDEVFNDVVSTPKKEVTPPGSPWAFVGSYPTFEEANIKRKTIKEGYVKIKRRTNGTFTVHTRDTPPGVKEMMKSQAKNKKK